METVVVGMSGGVDSSVAAYLLKEQGYRVIGLFMKNWDEASCPAEADEADVARVCAHLDIPHYTVNFTKEYWDEVFAEFLDGLKRGITPNPDILCNQKIKFAHFLKKAKEIGADKLATGHYCQLSPAGQLLRGADPNKDQSYFTYAVPTFDDVLFPIGHLPKPQVRELAREAGLPTAEKKDSTGICFIGKRDFRTFMREHLRAEEGNLMTPAGKILGRHIGTPFYTVGQRKGLGIGGPGEPWFVAGKNVERNEVVVVQGHDHPALLSESLLMEEVVTRSPLPANATAKVRYRTADVPCRVEGNRVLFDTPVWAATPGQSIVFYDNEVCLGGGIISSISCLQPTH